MRALLIVLDGAGCGPAPDAAAFGDAGANTLGHIFQAEPGLELPALFSLGLWKVVTSDVFSARAQGTIARWGRMQPKSRGKDSLSGHWEMAGAVLHEEFAACNQLPDEFVQALACESGTSFLAKQAEDSRTVLEDLGEEHLRTGRPILYMSPEPALQIAAHEAVLPPARLHALCRLARRRADAFRIGQVVARPFTGNPGAFHGTAGQHVYPMVPPRTILNGIAEKGLPVHGVGRIRDLFAGSGITRSTPTRSDQEGMEAIDALWHAEDDGLIFANLADSDALHGHARDLPGFARALANFDEWLAAFLPRVDEEDLVIVTADHGNDPSFPGTCHTREEVPLMVVHRHRQGPLGTRKTFADVASTLAEFFHVRGGWGAGRSFLR